MWIALSPRATQLSLAIVFFSCDHLHKRESTRYCVASLPSDPIGLVCPPALSWSQMGGLAAIGCVGVCVSRRKAFAHPRHTHTRKHRYINLALSTWPTSHYHPSQKPPQPTSPGPRLPYSPDQPSPPSSPALKPQPTSLAHQHNQPNPTHQSSTPTQPISPAYLLSPPAQATSPGYQP